MSDEASAIARNHSRSQGTARLVLLGIANHDSDGGASVHMATLATYANVTERNAQKAVERLAGHTDACRAKTRATGKACRDHLDVPEIQRVLNGGGRLADPNHERPNLYRFLLECPPRCDRTKFHRIRCDVCGKPVPHDRRWVGTHTRCAAQLKLGMVDPATPAPPVGSDTPPDPLSDPTPPVGSDTRTRPSVETERETYVPERAREAERGPHLSIVGAVCERGHALLEGARSCELGHYYAGAQLHVGRGSEGSPIDDAVALATSRGTSA